jgi:hypothetical protein
MHVVQINVVMAQIFDYFSGGRLAERDDHSVESLPY